jgi:FAD/FMN-containing dehydrogenase
VSKAVLFAVANNLELATKGGGHATSGSSSTEGGLCIDLSLMRDVSVDVAANTVTAQGGCVWEDVDNAAAEHGLAAIGGTVNNTGIGGLTLGGGQGYLTAQVGLVIDNLLAVEMVLADGSVVTASEKSNPDLFWAVRGAGAAFGVATSFVYRAHEQKNPVWAGLVFFPTTHLEEVIKHANLCMDCPEQERLLMLLGFGVFFHRCYERNSADLVVI